VSDRPTYFAIISDVKWQAVVIAIRALLIAALGICEDLVGRERSIEPKHRRGK